MYNINVLSTVSHLGRQARHGLDPTQLGLASLARLLIRAGSGQPTCQDLSPGTT